MVERHDVREEIADAVQRLIDGSRVIDNEVKTYGTARAEAIRLGTQIVIAIVEWASAYAETYAAAKVDGRHVVRYLNEQVGLENRPSLANGYRLVARCADTLRTYAPSVPPYRELIIEIARWENNKPGSIARAVAMGDLHPDLTITQIRRLGKAADVTPANDADDLHNTPETESPAYQPADDPEDDPRDTDAEDDESPAKPADPPVEYVFAFRADAGLHVDITALEVAVAEVGKAFGLRAYPKDGDQWVKHAA